MDVGEAWAYRTDPRAVGAPVSRVEVVGFGSGPEAGSAYVRFFEGEEAGLHQWVRESGLLVPWDQAGAFIRDDRREAAVAAASRVVRGTVEFAAAQLVLGVVRPKGRLRLRGQIADAGVLEIGNLDLVASWLALSAHQLRREPLVFEDRHGRCLAPWPVALMVSRRAAREFADAVLQEARRREEGLAQEQAVPPWLQSRADARRSFQESQLRLVREWCADRRGFI
jgi:hypothetical protein